MPDLFGRIAPRYDRFFRAPEAGPLLRLLRVLPGQWVLDLGGGTGRVGRLLAGMLVLICDLSAGMVREASRRGLLACQGKAEALPFGEAVFDAVLVVDAFHHFAGQQEAAREMLRVLRPAGRLVLEEPDIRRPFMRLVSLVERLLGLESRMLRAQEMRSLFEAVGGVLIGEEMAGVAIRFVVVPYQTFE